MSLQFIFGAGGAGKTEYILQYFLKEAPKDLSKNWFLIVPEQDTLAMQKRITGHGMTEFFAFTGLVSRKNMP